MSKEVGMDPERLDRVRQMVIADNRNGKVDGATLMVARRGQMVLDLVDGWADKKAGRKLEDDAVFAAMSITKQFTGVVALSFVERGLLQLHQPIAELLPQFRVPGKEKIHLYHLLTHTSGLLSRRPAMPLKDQANIERMVAVIAETPLESLPGERVNYSMMAAHSVIAQLCVVADGGGRSFSRILDEELFQPLNMQQTSLGPRADLVERLCPIRANFDHDLIMSPKAFEAIAELVLTPGGELPGGGALTTNGDLFRFAEMLRRGGELDGARILAPSTLKFATQVQTGTMRNIIHDETIASRNWTQWPANIGLGFYMNGEGISPGPFGRFLSARAFGGLGGRSTMFMVDPEYDLTISFLSAGNMPSAENYERFGKMTNMIVSSVID